MACPTIGHAKSGDNDLDTVTSKEPFLDYFNRPHS